MRGNCRVGGWLHSLVLIALLVFAYQPPKYPQNEMKDYELTIQEISDCVMKSQAQSARNAEHAAQKKLLEYMVENLMILHIDKPPHCTSCQLLKDFDIGVNNEESKF